RIGADARARVHPPRLSADPSHELEAAEGLGHVVVRSHLERAYDVQLAIASRQDDDRGMRRFSNSREYLEPVHLGQADVQHDNVWLLLEERLEPGAPILSGADPTVVPLEGERDAKRVAHGGVVVDYEKFHMCHHPGNRDAES